MIKAYIDLNESFGQVVSLFLSLVCIVNHDAKCVSYCLRAIV